MTSRTIYTLLISLQEIILIRPYKAVTFKKTLIFILVHLFILNTNAQSIKGLYVDSFDQIIGDINKEDSLLNYAQQQDFNYLTLYDLWPIHVTYDLTNVNSATILGDFIQKAKEDYGIIEIGATGENFFFFNNVIRIYNTQETNPLRKFDVYNVEFEFWNTNTVTPGNYYCTTYLEPNGYSCDTSGAFSYYQKLIKEIDSLAKLEELISETYVGWFNQSQAVKIADIVDRILLHDYISDYSWLYNYINTRLEYIASRNKITDIIPLFSSEPSFMGPWLETNSVSTPYFDLLDYLNNEQGSWKQYINITGYQWFTYSFMPHYSPINLVEDKTVNQIKLYPNPTSDFITIESEQDLISEVTIVNNLGETCLTHESKLTNHVKLDLSQLKSGAYICFIQTNNKIITKKIMR